MLNGEPNKASLLLTSIISKILLSETKIMNFTDLTWTQKNRGDEDETTIRLQTNLHPVFAERGC